MSEINKPEIPMDEETPERIDLSTEVTTLEELESSQIDEMASEEHPNLEPEAKLDDVASLSEAELEQIQTLTDNELLIQIEAIVNAQQVYEQRHKLVELEQHYQHLQAARPKASEEIPSDPEINKDPSPEELMDKRYQSLRQSIREQRQKHREAEELQKQDNLKKKLAVLDDLKSLIDSEESLKTTYDEFKKLQDTWKEIGQIPKNEINNLWQSYHFLVEKFFDKVKINRELRDLDLKKNLEQKIELCEKAEELLIEPSFNKAFKLLQEYHERWKEIGPVIGEKKDEIWERFRTVSDEVNAKRKAFYELKKDEFEQNFLAKKALCGEMETLVKEEYKNIRDWNKGSEKVAALINLWKSIGRASKNQNELVWSEFKTLLNTFSTNKRAFLETIKNEQLNNYNLKLNLCVQAEAIAERNDYNQATKDILALQEEWKQIGPSAKKNANKVWLRFRKACDTFFANKVAAYKETRGHENENLSAKSQLIQEIKSLMTTPSEQSQALDKMKEFQRRWNEIGHVPIKDKDRVYQEFRQSIDAWMELFKLKGANNAHRQTASYDNTRSKGGQNNQISKLREDIQIWENNVEFFAHSKNANILKEEFLKKIQKAKQDLALMEARLRAGNDEA